MKTYKFEAYYYFFQHRGYLEYGKRMKYKVRAKSETEAVEKFEARLRRRKWWMKESPEIWLDNPDTPSWDLKLKYFEAREPTLIYGLGKEAQENRDRILKLDKKRLENGDFKNVETL